LISTASAVQDGEVFRALPASAFLVVAAPLVAAAIDGGGRSVIASCADGSVIFATKWEDVHCAGAIRMPPGHVPRVGSMRDRAAAIGLDREAARERDLEEQIAEAIARRPATSRTHPAPVTLTPRERADLRHFVALGRAPAAATIEYERNGSLDRMCLAYARWFDTRMRHAFAAWGISLTGPVLVFRLEPSASGESAPMPSFAQGGATFRPDASDARQLGWIAEGGAASRPPASRLGYVVLPSGFDVNRPLAIFWGDAVVTTRPWRRS
jgi:hypothetical protein